MSSRKSLTAVWRDAIRDSDLLATAKLVAHTIATYSNGAGLAHPSQATIADGASLSKGRVAVGAAVDVLEERGWLAVLRSKGRASHRTCSLFPQLHTKGAVQNGKPHSRCAVPEAPTARLMRPTAHLVHVTAHDVSTKAF